MTRLLMAGKYGFEGGHKGHLHGRASGSGDSPIGDPHLAGSHVDWPNNHGANDHLASIYDSQPDQFKTVVPFLRQGLERGERCLYVVDDNTEEEVLEALQAGGIDVGAALESGALSIHTKSDTYLRTGEFEPDAMFKLMRKVLTKATSEGYTGIRGTAEMTWALGEQDGDPRSVEETSLSDEVSLGQLAEYEALLNNILSGEDYVILCQYNRQRFPEEVLSEVIRSHPFVVYNGTICENHHYYPPEKFFGARRPLLDIDRTLEGLLSRARTQRKLQERERYQSKLFEITSSPDRSFEEKLKGLFDLGCEYFGLKVGGLACIDQRTDLLEVETISRQYSHLASGKQYPLSETYFRLTAKEGGTVAVSDSLDRERKGALCYLQFGVRAYIGTLIELDGTLDRVFFFVSNEPREKPFSKSERTFHRLMSQWVEQELQRKRSEEDLKQLTQTLEERVETRTRQKRKLTAKVTLAEQRERDRIARRLHDSLQQRLFGSQLKISSLREEAIRKGDKELAGRIETLEDEIEEVAEALWQLSVGMSPPVLEGEGLKGVLEWLQSHMMEAFGLKVDLKAEREFQVGEEMRVLLFRTTKELLSTLAECPDTREGSDPSGSSHTSEYSDTNHATVRLHEAEGALVIEVVGEGKRFDPETLSAQGAEEALGLKAACERLRLFGGELKLSAGPEEIWAEIRVPREGSLPTEEA